MVKLCFETGECINTLIRVRLHVKHKIVLHQACAQRLMYSYGLLSRYAVLIYKICIVFMR